MFRMNLADAEAKRRKLMPKVSRKALETAKKFAMKRPSKRLPAFLVKTPLDIRTEIYAEVFRSTRIVSGDPRLDHVGLESTPNGLALLRVCRQISRETGNSWIGQVLFCFETCPAMLDSLSSASLHIRSLVRRVRVAADPWVIVANHDRFIAYRVCQALKMLPGLKLDRLTVLASHENGECRYALDLLAKYSDGWRELCFLTHNGEFLKPEETNEKKPGETPEETPEEQDSQEPTTVPQPETWQEQLETRDYPASGTSVTVHRVEAPKEHRNNSPPLVMVLAKWSRDAAYGPLKPAPHPSNEIRRRFPGRGWGQIMAGHRVRRAMEDTRDRHAEYLTDMTVGEDAYSNFLLRRRHEAKRPARVRRRRRRRHRPPDKWRLKSRCRLGSCCFAGWFVDFFC